MMGVAQRSHVPYNLPISCSSNRLADWVARETWRLHNLCGRKTDEFCSRRSSVDDCDVLRSSMELQLPNDCSTHGYETIAFARENILLVIVKSIPASDLLQRKSLPDI
jgi:hypothetical protein